MTQAQINASFANHDRMEIAFCRKEYLAAKAAWEAHGSGRNIDRFFAAEARYLAVKDAIKQARA